MKILVSVVLLFLTLFANNIQTLRPSPYQFVKITMGHNKPTFLEVGSDNCPGCIKMGKKLYQVKNIHPEYQLHYINIEGDRQTADELQVNIIPTQIIYDSHAKEIYRHVGVLEDRELYQVLQKYGFEK